MAVRRFSVTKDNVSWDHVTDDLHKGAGAEVHWLGGRILKRQYWTNARAQCDWDGVVRVTSARLVLTGDDTHTLTGNTAAIILRRIRVGQSWDEGNAVGRPPGAPGDDWETSEYEKPAVTDEPTIRATATGGLSETSIDVLRFLPHWAPKRVKFVIGGPDNETPGRWEGDKNQSATEQANANNEGFRAFGTSDEGEGWEFFSSDATNSNVRPYIEIEFSGPNAPPVAGTLNPRDATLEDEEFQVAFSDPDLNDTFTEYQIQARRVGQTEGYVWTYRAKASTQEREEQLGRVRLPLNKFTVGPQYEWRCRVWDGKGLDSPWTAWRGFNLTGNAPTISTHPLGTIGTLDGVRFIADWNHPDGRPILSVRLQLRPNTPAGSPLWDGQDNAWDSGDVTPTSGEQSAKQVNRDYKGDSLLAGDYSWRVMVRDRLGVDSLWAYDNLTLTEDYDPDPEDYAFTSGYEPRLHAYRIVLYDMGTDRGPGAIKAIIEDAANVGASMYVNAPGEVYFTLPATHWQVSECEPYQRHYSLQQYTGGAWKERFAGILTDFDSTGDDAVIYGMDYLGLLSIDIERRFSGNGKKVVEDGGAKYGEKRGTSPKRKWRISEIIDDQVTAAKNVAFSTTGFISTGRWDLLGEQAMIDASFRPRLEFIRGLIDSSRAGTGARTRLAVRRARTPEGAPGSYQWHLLKNPGKKRPELRMEFGGIIQGFRVVAMGDFAVKGYGIGRKVNEIKPFYKSDVAGTGSRQNELLARYGSISKVAVWNDIADENDLLRRVQQMTAESSTVGKRMALGLRVHAISPFDGWDLCDSVPIAINRGVVHTGLYGSGTDPTVDNPQTGEPYDYGWWVIWGTEWRLFPDGHDETTLVVRPMEDDIPPSADLIPSSPFPPTKEWTYGIGSPDDWWGVAPASLLIAPGVMTAPGEGTDKTTYYVDQSTGQVWVLQDDETYIPMGNNWADPLSPDTPQGLAAIAGYRMVGITWSRPGEGDLDHFEVRYTTNLADADSWTVLETHGTGAVIGDLEPDVLYWFQVRAVDRLGLTQTSDIDPTPVDATENTEAGWCPAVTATPTLVGQEDLVVSGLIAQIIQTDQITADAIFGGTLTVGQAGLGAVIEVFDGQGRLIGIWNTNGLVIVDPDRPGRAIWLSAGEMRVTDSLLWAGSPSRPDPVNSQWTQSVTAEGINATAIRFGKTPGGNNGIPNSGFELTPFTSLLSKVWTSAADWATGTSQVSVDVTTADLKLTNATY